MRDNERVKGDADEKWNFTIGLLFMTGYFEKYTISFATAQMVGDCVETHAPRSLPLLLHAMAANWSLITRQEGMSNPAAG